MYEHVAGAAELRGDRLLLYAAVLGIDGSIKHVLS